MRGRGSEKGEKKVGKRRIRRWERRGGKGREGRFPIHISGYRTDSKTTKTESNFTPVKIVWRVGRQADNSECLNWTAAVCLADVVTT